MKEKKTAKKKRRKKDGLTVRNIRKTDSLVVFSLLFFRYSLWSLNRIITAVLYQKHGINLC